MPDDATDRGTEPELLATVLHEVRTPLACLATTIEVLVAGFRDLPRDEVLAHLRRMQRSTAWLQSLVDNLTVASQVESRQLHLRLEAVPVRACLENCLALVSPLLERAGQRVALSGDLDAEIVGDSRRIEQVLVNLLTNASKYGAGSAPIEIRVRRQEGRVRVTVSDRGPGIAPREQANIFDRYVRGEAAAESGATGLGLGLHIVKTLVERQGGSVGVESRPGRGASFWFEIPAVPVSSAQSTAIPRAAAEALRRGRARSGPKRLSVGTMMSA